MPDKPDDRPKASPTPADADPRVFVVVDGRRLPRPGLETFFARGVEKTQERAVGVVCTCDAVRYSYCSCNKVCRCVPACGCVAHVSCGCDSHYSGGGGRVVGCRCAPVH